ncbi:immunoglobulin domain-containing protein [Acanthopleuribacter pedis]|uniref:Immunoglobulin domain-containing protein n=1 Tax=Acanthopleuribacter pedis TaxID=442870 RepID=A0A8J7QFN4_9BACT|nr:immunoglobulin domain-containing protein [Acanthopleuribacter pedis]MBO1317590.1 immunoglobulin domain-containing protein [Acanthopleuribacter pedis]
MVNQVCCSLFLFFVLSSFVVAQTQDFDISSPNLVAQMNSVTHGEKVTLHGFSFDERRGFTPMELERFDVFHPEAVMTVHGDNGPRVVGAPEHAYFKGAVSGMPGSAAYLSMRDNGEVRGLVSWQGRNWIIEERLDRSNQTIGLLDVEVTNAVQNDPYTCGLDALPEPDETPVSEEDAALLRHAQALPPSRMPTADYYATIAIDTDHEFYNLFGNEQDALTYIGDLFGYISTIYQNDLGTALLVGDTTLWSTSNDPWSGNSTICQLLEMGDYWNSNKTSTPRTAAHFLSGKRTGGGVAWLGVLCGSGFNYPDQGCGGLSGSGRYGGDYGVSANLSGNFNINNPSMVWDVVVVAHELGHNFNSPHTHCYGGIGGNASPVDQCYAGEGGCYSGGTSLPCGQSRAGCGTIMSYCHLLSGGTANIGPTFGLNHAHGVAPERVPARMRSHVESRSNSNPSCLPQTCNAPSISNQSSSSTQCVGANVTLSVTAEGTGLSYQWRKDGSPISGQTGSTLTFSGIQSGDAGSYDCVITNECGSETSNAVTLTVDAGTAVTQQPSGAEICAGQTLELSVAVSGSGLSYQWQRNGQNINGATGATYRKTGAVSGDAGEYRCVISSANCGTLNTNTATVVVSDVPDIQEQPENTIGCIGGQAFFAVFAEGRSLTYQWQKDGQNLAGQTGSTLTLSGLSVADAGSYRCIVTGDCGSSTSGTGSLTVNPATVVTQQPTGAVVCTGDDRTLSVRASGSNVTYQWQQNGQNMPGQTSPDLNLTNIRSEASYRCRITSDCGTLNSETVSVALADLPVIRNQPRAQQVCAGDNATFSVSADSEQPLRYQWRKDGQNLDGQNSATLNLSAVSLADAGQYFCVVWNSNCGSVLTESVALNVSATPEIISEPSDVFGCIGDQVTMTVEGNHATRYQWRKDGQPLAGQTSASLTLDLQDFDQEGVYDCLLENDCGSVGTRGIQVDFDAAFAVEVAYSSVAQGLTPVQVSGQISCRDDGMSWLWQDLATGNVLGRDALVFDMPFLYDETSVVIFRVEDAGGQVIRRYVTVLVSEDDTYVDANGDGCNSIQDLHFLAEQWRTSQEMTPNGDTIMDVRDFLFIDTRADNCPQ